MLLLLSVWLLFSLLVFVVAYLRFGVVFGGVTGVFVVLVLGV